MEAVEPLSPKAYQVAEEYQLGTLLGEYRHKLQPRLSESIVYILIGIMLIFTMLWIGHFSPFIPDFNNSAWLNPFTLRSPMYLFFVAVGGLCLLLGLAGLWINIQAVVKGVLRFYVGTKGFAIVYGQKRDVVHLDDIEEIQHRMMVQHLVTTRRSAHEKDSQTMDFYTVVCKDGTKKALQGEAGALIEAEYVNARFPQSWQAYQNGKRLNFGWLSLDLKGIRLHISEPSEIKHVQQPAEKNVLLRLAATQLERNEVAKGTAITSGKQFLSWQEMELPWIDEERRALVIDRSDEPEDWAVLPLGRIPDVALFLALVEHILKDTQLKRRTVQDYMQRGQARLLRKRMKPLNDSFGIQ